MFLLCSLQRVAAQAAAQAAAAVADPKAPLASLLLVRELSSDEDDDDDDDEDEEGAGASEAEANPRPAWRGNSSLGTFGHADGALAALPEAALPGAAASGMPVLI